MRMFKKVVCGATAMALAAGMSGMPVFAAETGVENGDYTATIHFHNASNPSSYSMCDSIFAHEANLSVTEDGAELQFYVAYPVPSFSDQGTDGTIKDVKVTYNETVYNGDIDITSKPVKTFDTTGALFGINAGDQLPTEVVTVSLPREAVNAFEEGVATSAYVNVVMNSNTDFVMKVTDLQKVVAPTETSTQSTQVTADIAAPAPSYDVTIPASVAMGTLSAETDNAKEYAVKVTAENLGTGKVEISTAAAGELKSGDNSLAFANSFGTQSTSETGELAGIITVKAADVQKAAAGNYTGTANFSISYYAGE